MSGCECKRDSAQQLRMSGCECKRARSVSAAARNLKRCAQQLRMSKRNLGMTMIETTVVLMIIAVLIAAATTGIYATVANARDKAAMDQLVRLKQGIVGEQPRTIPPGEKNITRHGYVGDMG